LNEKVEKIEKPNERVEKLEKLNDRVQKLDSNDAVSRTGYGKSP